MTPHILELRLPIEFLGNLDSQMATRDLEQYGYNGVLDGIVPALMVMSHSQGTVEPHRESIERFFDYDYFYEWVSDRFLGDPYQLVLCRRSTYYDIILEATMVIIINTLREWKPLLSTLPWESLIYADTAEIRLATAECKVRFQIMS